MTKGVQSNASKRGILIPIRREQSTWRVVEDLASLEATGKTEVDDLPRYQIAPPSLLGPVPLGPYLSARIIAASLNQTCFQPSDLTLP